MTPDESSALLDPERDEELCYIQVLAHRLQRETAGRLMSPEAWIGISEAQKLLTERCFELTKEWLLAYRVAWQIIEHGLAEGRLRSRPAEARTFKWELERSQAEPIPMGPASIDTDATIPTDFWFSYAQAGRHNDPLALATIETDRTSQGSHRDGDHFRFRDGRLLGEVLAVRVLEADLLEWLPIEQKRRRGRPRGSGVHVANDEAVIEQAIAHMLATGDRRPYAVAKLFVDEVEGHSDTAKVDRLGGKISARANELGIRSE